MNAPHNPLSVLPDTQASQDVRNLAINKAGIKGLRYPVVVEIAGELQHTVALWSMYVGLSAETKGTHMSRFVESLEELGSENKALKVSDFVALEAAMRQRMDGAAVGKIEVSFPLFLRKTAPISKVTSLLDYTVTITVETSLNHVTTTRLKVLVPVKSLCPCSKNISEYGAHNQRSHITLDVQVCGELRVEELIRIAEEEASCEIFGLLKRSDEKWVTERAYENPKFVEDLVRDLALRVRAHPAIGYFCVAAENFESIHNHSAYAEIEGMGAAGVPIRLEP